jgi:hypothetical protein
MDTYRTLHSRAHADLLHPNLAVIFRIRVARVMFGVVLGASAIVSVLLAGPLEGLLGAETEQLAPIALLMSWPLAAAAYLATRGLLRAANATADADIVTQERRLYAIEVAGIALPLAGIAFATPLTLHSFVAMLGGTFEKFGEWMIVSGAVVGHAHLGLALHGWLGFARGLHRTPSTEKLRVGLDRSWAGALAVAVACAAVPGVILVALPPVIVLVTGIAFIPIVYGAMERTFARERRTIAHALGALTT